MAEKLTQVRIQNDHHENYWYVFEPQALNAIKAAVLIQRPLLVKGKPGSGKSQLAKAAAAYLGRAFVSTVVTAKTEAQQLLWSFDAVARLADAQIEGALCRSVEEKQQVRERLALANYIRPEVLWMGLNWKSAEAQFQRLAKRLQLDHLAFNNAETARPQQAIELSYCLDAKQAEQQGVVVLIDEIDKADSSLPNGLLEVLGANQFQPEGFEQPVILHQDGTPAPLIIITSNDEQPLPEAFVRRCLQVEVGLPEDRAAQKRYLVRHAEPNFPDLAALSVQGAEQVQSVLAAVAEQVLADRQAAQSQNIKPLPGQAEYFDVLRGLQALRKRNYSDSELIDWVQRLAQFSSQRGQKAAKAD